MTVTAAVVVAPDEDPPWGPVPVGDPVVELLVGRLHAEYGVDRDEIRCLATELLGTFATARVQAFVPILVEKRLRATYRPLRDGAGPAGPGAERDARPDPPAGAGRPPR